jgi:DNA-binding NarL/FixJ family response regulator
VAIRQLASIHLSSRRDLACSVSFVQPHMPTTVLIVDDSLTLRGALRDACAKQDDLQVVGEAGDGIEALQMAPELRPDVIVLDLRMPHLNGVETAMILKKRLPGTGVILFTLYDESLGARLSATIGVDLIVSKSEGISALLRAIRQWVKANIGCDAPPSTKAKSRANHG